MPRSQPKPTTEVAYFRGLAYYRYPNALRVGLRKYFRRAVGRTKVAFLHRVVWEFYHKRGIPKGHHVHHRDGDTGNNLIGNLELLSAADHARRHHQGHCSPATRAHLERARELGRAWHSTESGVAFHKRAATETAEALPSVEVACKVCGQTRLVKQIGRHGRKVSDFCSNRCRYAGGADHEDRTCRVCSKPFRCLPWRKPDTTCSRSCANQARRLAP
jgi:hypothetical protein